MPVKPPAPPYLGPAHRFSEGSNKPVRRIVIHSTVSPCEPGGKRPLTKNGFWDATVEEREIRAWWGRWPHANVAIPTGQASGLMVLDADAGDGPKSLRRLELEVGRVPETLGARTGG